MDTQNINDEKENLRKTDSLTVIEYIKSSIDILIQMKVDEQVESIQRERAEKEEDQQDYESVLVKLESDIRGHIRV
jgi:hypothetical protein